MKNPVIALRALVVAGIGILSVSCTMNLGDGIRGSGNVVKQTRNIPGNFSAITVDSGIEVEVTQDENASVVVEADDNVQKHITTTVENGVLHISTDRKGFINVESMKVIVVMPKVTKLETSGGSSLSSKGAIISEDLSVRAESGSSVTLDVEADNLICETESGSTTNIRGKALLAETSSSSGSTLDASDLLANEVRAQAAGGSSLDVRAIVKLEAKASSGSSIDYHGSPKTISVGESSGGSVTAN